MYLVNNVQLIHVQNQAQNKYSTIQCKSKCTLILMLTRLEMTVVRSCHNAHNPSHFRQYNYITIQICTLII